MELSPEARQAQLWTSESLRGDGGSITGGGDITAYFFQTGADGQTMEGRTGEACCLGCGEFVLAKYSNEGELLEDPHIVRCSWRRPESTARICFYIISTIRASRMPQDR